MIIDLKKTVYAILLCLLCTEVFALKQEAKEINVTLKRIQAEMIASRMQNKINFLSTGETE